MQLVLAVNGFVHYIMGRPPKYLRPTRPTQFRLDPELYEAIVAAAQAQGENLIDLVERALHFELKRIARATRSATNVE